MRRSSFRRGGGPRSTGGFVSHCWIAHTRGISRESGFSGSLTRFSLVRLTRASDARHGNRWRPEADYQNLPNQRQHLRAKCHHAFSSVHTRRVRIKYARKKKNDSLQKILDLSIRCHEIFNWTILTGYCCCWTSKNLQKEDWGSWKRKRKYQWGKMSVEDAINYKPSEEEDYYALLSCDESSTVRQIFWITFARGWFPEISVVFFVSFDYY